MPDTGVYTYYLEWRRPFGTTSGAGSGTINVMAQSIEEAIAKGKAQFVSEVEIYKITRSA